jgi:hypothetical protein
VNICEVAKIMKPLQKVKSESAQVTLIMDEDGYRFHYFNEESNTIEDYFNFNANEFLADDWEIVWEEVDFWTAWNAYKNEGKKIRCTLWKKIDKYYYSAYTLSYKEISANWIIVD